MLPGVDPDVLGTRAALELGNAPIKLLVTFCSNSGGHVDGHALLLAEPLPNGMDLGPEAIQLSRVGSQDLFFEIGGFSVYVGFES